MSCESNTVDCGSHANPGYIEFIKKRVLNQDIIIEDIFPNPFSYINKTVQQNNDNNNSTTS